MTKYNAKKTPCAHDHVHDSAMEARRCNDLHVLQAQGKISHLEHQPVYDCVIDGKRICKYIADFRYFISGDCRVVEDVKGFTTPVFNMKRRLVEALNPGTVITIYPPKKRKAPKRRAA